MEVDALTKLATTYGLPGLIVALAALYVWKVKIPADAKAAEAHAAAQDKRDTFIETLVTDGATKSQALIAAFREDLEKRDDKFIGALKEVEASHRESVRELSEAIRDGHHTGGLTT